MSATMLTTIIGAIISPLIEFIRSKICVLLGKIDKNSIVITYDEPLLIDSLISNDTMLINLDKEITSVLDSDEKDMTSNNSMINAKIWYTKSTVIITELLDVIIHSSNSTKKFVFCSCDYKLLKYGDTGTIIYTLPSEAYYNVLKLNVEWDDVKYQKIKTDLLSRKQDKIHIYSSFEQLQDILIKNYNFKIKC
jgi:hypothetical protein